VIDGKPETETQIIQSLIEVLPDPGKDPGAASAEPHFVDVFAEDTPSGLRKARHVVNRLRAITRRRETKYGEKARSLEIQIVPVPKEITALDHRLAEVPQVPSLRRAFHDALVRPSELDVRTGVLVGTYRGIMSFSTWFSTPEINPLLATGIATFQTALTTFNGTFSRSMANVFRLNLRQPGIAPIWSRTILARRLAYSLLMTEITQTLTGTPPGFDSMWSLGGQAQIITLSRGFSTLDSLIMNARDKAFLLEPAHFARVSLASFFLLTPWQLLDSAGTFPVLLDLGVYSVRATTIGMLATYFGLNQAINRAPDKVGVIVDRVIGPLDKGVDKIQRSVGRRCQSVFAAAENFGDEFKDSVR
jgi:hypothetical protein